MKEPKFINGLSQIYSDYDGFIIDLWGVLHDGTEAYPKAIETIKNLKNSGKKIVLLSNAPRRSFVAQQTLERLGFKAEYYDEVITSGEVTFEYVRDNNLGDRYFYIGPEKDRNILDGLNLKEVPQASEAGFAVVTGFDGFHSAFEEKQAQVDKALQAGLILLCANPDFKVVKQTGEVQICAGLIAEYYEKNGGKVLYFGKPYEAVYKKSIGILGISNPQKILCIGDAIHTDITGGNNFGADTLFVAGGIHKNELVKSDYLDLTKFKEICDDGVNYPDYVIKEFFW